LDYWSLLQYHAWSAALGIYEPRLVSSIGALNIVEALKTNASFFPIVKPLIRGESRSKDETVIRYRLPDVHGQVFQTSISWRRIGGKWRIHYDPQLDGMLQTERQATVQNELDPNASTPSPKARQAGAAAASWQSAYLQRYYGK
jgi:hypothetical protein